MRAWSAALVALLALVGVTVLCAAPAAAAGSPDCTLTVRPDTVRDGRPVTLLATVTGVARDFLPAHVAFLDRDAKIFGVNVALDDDFTSRLTLEPELDGYTAWVFSDSGQGGYPPLIHCNIVNVTVITGFTVTIGFTTVPANAGPGDDALVRVTVTGHPVNRPTEGAGQTPSGAVSVLSGANTLGTRTLNNQGKADVPVTLPANGAPITTSYEGDDLFLDSSSAPYVPPDPADPTTPTTTPPGGPVSADGSVPGADVNADDPTTPSTVPTTSTIVPTSTVVAETAAEPEVEGDEVEAAAALAPVADGDGDDSSVERSSFVFGIPTPAMLDWGAGHVVVNLLLALLLMLLTGIPSMLIDKTIEENYHRIVRSFAADEERAIHRVERWLQDLPDPVLLLGLSVVTAVVFSFLDPSSGFNASTLVLVAALTLAVGALIGLHDLARIPYLNRRFGKPAAVFGVYPFSLVLAAILVFVSRVSGFEPGYVFGIVGTLAVKETVSDKDEASTLAAVGVGFLGVALLSWWLWHPIAEDAMGADPGATTIFLDAFLSGLWLAAVQGVAFGFAPMRFLDGGAVRQWSRKAWLAIWGAGMFLMVQFYLHPSAGRWGALDSTSMRTALSVWGLFLVAALLFWAWFRFRADPGNEAEVLEEASV